MDVLIPNSVSRQIPYAQQTRLLGMLSQQPGKQLAAIVTGISVQSSEQSSSSPAPIVSNRYQVDFLIGKETVSLTTKVSLLVGEQLVLMAAEKQILSLIRQAPNGQQPRAGVETYTRSATKSASQDNTLTNHSGKQKLQFIGSSTGSSIASDSLLGKNVLGRTLQFSVVESRVDAKGQGYTAILKNYESQIKVRSLSPLQVDHKLSVKVVSAQTLIVLKNHSENNNERSSSLSKPFVDADYQPLLKIFNKHSATGLADRQGNWQATVQASWLLEEDEALEARFGARLVKNNQVVEVITSRPLLAGQQLKLKVEDSQHFRFGDSVQGLPKTPAMLSGSTLQLMDKGMTQALSKMAVDEMKVVNKSALVNAQDFSGLEKAKANREMPLHAKVTSAQIKPASKSPTDLAQSRQHYALQLKIGQLNVEVLSSRAILPGQQLVLKLVANHQLQILNQQATGKTEDLGVAPKMASPIVDIVSGSPQAIKYLQARQGQIFQAMVLSSNVISASNRGLSSTALTNYSASLATPEAELLEVRSSKALPKGAELSFRVLDNHRLKLESSQGSPVNTGKEPAILSVVKMPPLLAGQLVQRQSEQLQATVIEARVNVDNVSAKTVTYLATLKIGDQQLEVASKQLLTAGQNLNLKVNNAVELELNPRTNPLLLPASQKQSLQQSTQQPIPQQSESKPSVVMDTQLTRISESVILKGSPQFILQLDKQLGQILVATVVQSRVASDSEVFKAIGQRVQTEPVQPPGQVLSLKVGKNTFDVFTTRALNRGDTLNLRVINAQQLQLLDKTNDSRKVVPDLGASQTKGLPSSPQSLTQAVLRVESKSLEALQRLATQDQLVLAAKVISSRLLAEPLALSRNFEGKSPEQTLSDQSGRVPKTGEKINASIPSAESQGQQGQVKRAERERDIQRHQQIAQQNQAKNMQQRSVQAAKQRYYEVELQIDKERILVRSAQDLAPGRSIDLQLLGQDKLQIMKAQQAIVQQVRDQQVRDQQQKLLADFAVKGTNVTQSYLPDITASLKQALQLVLEKQQPYAEFFKVFSQLQKGLGGTMSGPMATALSQLLAAIPNPGQLQTSQGLRDAVDNSGLFFEARQRLAFVQRRLDGSVSDQAHGLGRSTMSAAKGTVGAAATNTATGPRSGLDRQDNKVAGPGNRASSSILGQSENRHMPADVKTSGNREVSVDNKDRGLNHLSSPNQKSQAAPITKTTTTSAGKNVAQAISTTAHPADLGSVAGRDLKGNMFNVMNEIHNSALDSRFKLSDLLFSSQAPIAAISALSPVQREAYDAVASFFRFFVKNMSFSSKDSTSGRDGKVAKQDEERQQAVLRQLVSAISRTQLHQLNTVASQQSAAGDTTLLNSWTFELPVMNGAQLDIIEFRIDHEEEAVAENTGHEDDEKVRVWKVMLSFDIQPLGMMYVQIKLVLDSLSATFWSQRPHVLQVIEQEVGELKSNLTDLGVNVKEVNYIEGKPPSTAVRMDQYLVDVET